MMHKNRNRSKIFYGWWVVGSSLVITLFSAGTIYFGFTAVIEPIAEEFGWSYAQISFAASLRGLEMGLLAPLVGLLVDRWGPRRLVFGGGILISLGLFVLSRVSSLAMFYGAFALISVGMSATTGTVLVTAVVNWFRKQASIATGIVVSGLGLSGLLVPLITVLVDKFQWRTAMDIVGLGILVVVLPLSLLLRHKPEQYGYLPDGDSSDIVNGNKLQDTAEKTETSITAKQALRSRAFWHIAFAAMCHAFVLGALVTHIMPYLSSINIDRSTSSLVALLLPVTSISGRLGIGWLGDRMDGRWVYAMGFVLMTIGMLFCSYLPGVGMWMLVPFVIVFSFGWGGNVTMRMSLSMRYFGRASYGTILGSSSVVMMIGHMAGTPLAGWIYDTWGSYQGAWLGFTLVTLAGMVLALTIPAPES
ncbi:MFS transporter [Chloroflexota bacterium]